MTNKKFNVNQWLHPSATPQEQVETVTRRIEQAGIDIAPTYKEWCDLGFALAHGLGEAGRTYFHRLSRYYASYKPREADKQFTACLTSRGQGITLNTFFHLARRAGVDISLPVPPFRHSANPPTGGHDKKRKEQPPRPSPSVPEGDSTPEPLPAFPPQVYDSLPGLLSEVVGYGLSPEDTDMLLLGSLTVLSACLTQVSGIYGQRQVFPNLYLFVNARAATGKGRLTLCRHLVDIVHAELRRLNKAEWEEYRRLKSEYDQNKRKTGGEEPQPPPVRMLFVPANSTATALFQTLSENKGQALMMETEGDTLSTTLSSEHGNYSDGFRKAFHHESIAYNRRKDREYVEIGTPCLSVLLSGTPRQISTLIPDAENGLFSRFLFYTLPLRPVWNDVFAGCDEDTLDLRFWRLGGRFHRFYVRLQQARPITFTLTVEQQCEFNARFEALQEQGLDEYGPDLLPTMRRLGLSAFRICMVLSVLRLMDGEGDKPLPEVLACRDEDFRTAMLMVPVLLRHAGEVYRLLCQAVLASSQRQPHPVDEGHQQRMKALLQALPDRFSRAECIEAAAGMGITLRSAERYLSEYCAADLVLKDGRGVYLKASAVVK
ncbi:MAG: DUF3987 domain-containing protein [Bacteroides sp.]|nr:DUF3987 domain-containing protein [Bacteroides sp.]